jgi:NAD(P)H-dependent flavin oxidoreductase YrpB (nitropropane dioxygenase family)
MMFKGIRPIRYGGREVLPLIEGGKGVSATNHASSGAWAAAGGIGTVSAVNADSYDPEGKIIPQVYHALTRRDRHEELIHYAIEGASEQVRRAFEMTNGKGAININVLWEMGGAQRILHGVLERTRGMVAGVTCGAGMPYKLSEITGLLRRPLSADHQLRPRLQRAVEAGLFEVRRFPRGRRLRGSVARRRP